MKMTIVKKVFNLLNKYQTLSLKDIYTELPEHPKESIRGNINRHIKSESRLFKRSGKGIYSLSDSGESYNETTKTSNNSLYEKMKVVSLADARVKKLKKNNNLEVKYQGVSGLGETELEIVENYATGLFNSTVDNFIHRSSNLVQQGISNISSMLNKVMNMDAVKFLKAIPDNSVDLVVTDPPYPTISGGNSRKKGTPGGILQKNDGKIFEFNNLKFEDWIPELYRVMKENSHGYIMTNFLNLSKIMSLCEEAGFKIHNLLVWKKNNAVVNSWYMKNAEYTVFIRKGRAKKIHNAGSMTVHEIDNIKGKRLHPTEKPLELAHYYVRNSCVKDGIFLDLFSGAGAFAVSAFLNGMNVLSCEIDKVYHRVADNRLSNAIRLGYDNREDLLPLIHPPKSPLYNL